VSCEVRLDGNVEPDFATIMHNALDLGLIVRTGFDPDLAFEGYMLTNSGRRMIGMQEHGMFRDLLIKLGFAREILIEPHT